MLPWDFLKAPYQIHQGVMLLLPSKHIPNPTTPASPLLGQSKSPPSHWKRYNSFQTGFLAPTLTPSSLPVQNLPMWFQTYNKIQAKCLQALPDRVITYLSDIFCFSLLTLAPATLVFFLLLGHTRNLVLLLSFCTFSSLYQQGSSHRCSSSTSSGGSFLTIRSCLAWQPLFPQAIILKTLFYLSS